MQNETLLQKTVDFLEGRYPPVNYFREVYEKRELYAWLQSLVPSGRTRLQTSAKIVDGFYEFSSKEVSYDIFEDMQDLENPWHGRQKMGSIHYIYQAYHMVWRIFTEAFPEYEITPFEEYKEKWDLSFAYPDYIGGSEVDDQGVLDKIIDELPKDLSMSKKKALFKKLVREAFHVEGNKFPYWIQSPEWPVNNGIPLKFVKSKKINAEMKHHYFVDTVTGEERIVEDFY